MSVAIEIMFKGRRLGYYVNPERVPVSVGDHVIVEAERGVDMGEIRHLAVDASPSDRDSKFRAIVRRARRDDFRALDRIRKEELHARKVCRERIARLRLEMKLVDAESQLDGNRITFYFTAEKRVDFRELVKELAGVFKTRIELRQIGARDSAKRIGGIGPCGREYCCSTWLKDFSPVTLKMAKNQGLALAPSKISGGCGRLMCCLMYEDPFYKEMVRLFPKHGFRFEQGGTNLRVFQNDFFREVVKARSEEGEIHEWPLEAFPVPRDRWSGSVRARGAPGRGGDGSGCHKPDPKPTGMKNARGGKIPIRRAEEEAPGGAPFMHGGKKGRRAGSGEEKPAANPPAEMVRLEAQKRRREDGDDIGAGAPPSPQDLADSELVASAEPDPGSPPATEPGTDRTAREDEPRPRGKDEPRPRGRRRRRGRKRPRGGTSSG